MSIEVIYRKTLLRYIIPSTKEELFFKKLDMEIYTKRKPSPVSTHRRTEKTNKKPEWRHHQSHNGNKHGGKKVSWKISTPHRHRQWREVETHA